MTICLVTDRRRQPVVEQVRAAASAGIDFCQIRERDLDARALARLVDQAIEAARGTPTRVIVNDRLDVAVACGAAGVHLRADSVAPARVRTIAPHGFLVGRSVHDAAEARHASPDVDYLIAGTVFPTASKPEQTGWLGPAGLADVVAASTAAVLAIGGVSVETLRAIRAAGAAGVAAIGLFAVDPDTLPAVVSALRHAWAAAEL